MLRFRRWKNKTQHLPDFVIIGAQKSGTTSLFYNLNKHPHIKMVCSNPKTNEMHFFNNEDTWAKGIDWYKGHFNHPNCLQGEKTPEYFTDHVCHKRMASYIPKARLILLLRNPVDRAFSQWNHFNQIYTVSKKWGWEKTDFENSIERNKSVLLRGIYIQHIRHLLNYYVHDMIYIGVAERIQKNPQYEFNAICLFLGVKPINIEYDSRHVRDYSQPMKSETRKKLLEFYRPYNEELYDFLGYRISEWE
jgi:hypothetical protein